MAGELLAIRPGLPIALASGYITEELRERAARLGIRHLVYKPSTVEELCNSVHRLLGEGRQP